MKKVMVFICTIWAAGVMMGFSGKSIYTLGYNYKVDFVDIYQLLNTDIEFESQNESSYFNLCINITALNGLSPESTNVYIDSYLLGYKDIKAFFPGLDEILVNSIFYGEIKELYYDQYFSGNTLRVGRFYPNKASANLYSPSNVMQASNFLGYLNENTLTGIDGLVLQLFFEQMSAECYFTPVTKYDFPNLTAYEKTQSIYDLLLEKSGSESDYLLLAYKYKDRNVLRLDDMNTGLKIDFSIFDFSVRPGYFRNNYHFDIPELVEVDFIKNDIMLNLHINDITIDLSKYEFPPEIKDNPIFAELLKQKIIFDTDYSTSMTINTSAATSTIINPWADVITADIQYSSRLIEGLTWYFEAGLYLPQQITTKGEYSKIKRQDTIDITFEGTTNVFYSYTKQQNKEAYVPNVFSESLLGNRYVKYIAGFEYLTGDFSFGLEFFNGMNQEHFSMTPGIDGFFNYSTKIFDINLFGLVTFPEIHGKIDIGYTTVAKAAYTGMDQTRIGLKSTYSYSENEKNIIYNSKMLNSVEFFIEKYF
ncbi:MAG TPA: hypothetical protein PLM73_04730 [Petrotogaceae bacterium]|nr:hypothetical protein [Petrotogaceae bacterium]HQF32995.1 hypothetical protein [Petrotogaceae bacterium]HQH32911.1 hypothetical protein [Petrotogaceae bacterium]